MFLGHEKVALMRRDLVEFVRWAQSELGRQEWEGLGSLLGFLVYVV